MSNRLEQENVQRVKDRIERLGTEKLAALARELILAKEENERPIPQEILAGFKIPEIDSIYFIQSETARVGLGRLDGVFNNPTQRSLDSSSHRDLNLWLQVDGTTLLDPSNNTEIRSQFFNIYVYISTTNLNSRQRLYVPLFLDNLFVNPVIRANGEKLSWERVVQELDRDVIDYGACLGVGQAFEDLVIVKVKVAKDKYLEAVQWIYDILEGTQFDAERVGVSLSKMINNIPAQRRDGNGMNWSLYYDLILDENKSIAKASNFLTQEHFLLEIERVFDEDPLTILSTLFDIQKVLTFGGNFRVHIIGPVLGLDDPLSPWTLFTCQDPIVVTPIRYARELLSPVGCKPSKVATLLPLPSIESSFSIHFSRGLQEWLHPDLAPLLVLAEYLSLIEGYFWKGIRGSGLAYGTSLSLKLEEGMIYFSVYRSPNSALAFEKAREIVQDLISGKQAFDELTLDSAKSSLIYANACLTKSTLINQVTTESTLISAASSGFITQVLQKRPPGYRRDILKKIHDVKLEEMGIMLEKYVKGVFDPETSQVVVVCGTGKTQALEVEYQRMGFHTTVDTHRYDSEVDEE